MPCYQHMQIQSKHSVTVISFWYNHISLSVSKGQTWTLKSHHSEQKHSSQCNLKATTTYFGL